MAGTYEFAGSMCSGTGHSALCIDRHVTIEAEVAGSVVLDAKGARRGIYVSIAGRAELVGLNITGGAAAYVRFLERFGGGLHIRGTATLTNTNVYANLAPFVRSPFELSLMQRTPETLHKGVWSFFWHRAEGSSSVTVAWPTSRAATCVLTTQRRWCARLLNPPRQLFYSYSSTA